MTVDRSRLPVPGPVRPFGFPPIERSVLPSGMQVWTVRHASVPMLSFTLMVRRGSACDPGDRPGLASVTADMLDEGSNGQTSLAVHEALSRIGAQFDTDVGADAMALSITALSRFSDRALALLGDMLTRPTLAEADFERVRDLRRHRLAQLKDVPAAVAERAFVRLLYGSHPYGHSTIGDVASLDAMSIDQVRAFHAEAFRPSATTLLVVGDCDHESIRRVAEQAFAGWTGAVMAEPDNSSAVATPGPLNVIHRAGAPQSELRIGHVAVARATPDYHALVAMNMVLGGQFVSRINLNLREDKGFTYGARTAFDFRRLPGPFALQVSVQTNATGAAIAESLGELSDIRGARPVTADELAMGVAALTRGYARNFETAEQVARAVMQIALYDLPDDYFSDYVAAVERITPEDVTRVAEQYLDPARMTTLVVGDLDATRAGMAEAGLPEPNVLPSDAF